MMYLAWAAFYEGSSDASYYNVLLPRIMESIILMRGRQIVTVPEDPAVSLGRRGRAIDKVAKEICESSSAFHIVFIHADTGGRALEGDLSDRSSAYCRAAYELCQWPSQRCVVIAPRHETEAWMLADPNAVTMAFGYRGAPNTLNLPANAEEAERLSDPKGTLEAAHRFIRGRQASRSMLQALPTIARTQSIDLLRLSGSFRHFENNLSLALMNLGCIASV